MKLSEHVEKIRLLIYTAFRGKLGRMGIQNNIIIPINSTSDSIKDERQKLEKIFNILKSETGSHINAYDKLVEELTFTLFNRLAAIKVLEAHTLIPEIITRKLQHGGRSFSHLLWLEENPEMRETELEGISMFLEDKMRDLSSELDIFNLNYPYNFFPTAIEINNIFKALNDLDNDLDLDQEIWKSDDILGWMYESYNNYKREAFKASGEKTEYDKVSIQSQVYTPRWVVKFLVDNSLGKLYLEMYPDSNIKNKYKIANAPITQTRERKPLTELKLIDLVTGSGNFLLYGFDLFYDLYIDQIENYGNPDNYDIDKIPELIIIHNLHGIDLDDRAVQLAQLGLYIKVKRKKHSAKIDHFNIVSSDFFLPDYSDVKHLFNNGEPLNSELEKIVTDLWADLQQAFKFGSLIRLEEKFNLQIEKLVAQFEGAQQSFLSEQKLSSYEQFRENFFINLQKAVAQNTAKQGITFLNTKTQDAITFLQLLTQKYDVAVANPPYTDSGNFGEVLKIFVDTNYKKPYKFNSNLYASFIKRCCEIINDNGKVALVHPPTFMYIKTFTDVRKYILEKLHISLFVEWGYLGMFHPSARVDSAMYVLEKNCSENQTIFIKLNDFYEGKRYDILMEAYNDVIKNCLNKNVYQIDQNKLKIIDGYPFIYWISDEFRKKFLKNKLDDYIKVCSGLSTANNDRFLRFWWEVGLENISSDYPADKKKWVLYCKGGPYKKWAGNLWVCINYENNGNTLKKNGATLRNRDYYFIEGITCSGRSSSKGVSYRYFPKNVIFDVGATGLIPRNENSLWYGLAFMNSKLTSYILECLNPTVNTTEGDLQKIPFIIPQETQKNEITNLSKLNYDIIEEIDKYNFLNINFLKNPIVSFNGNFLSDLLFEYLNNCNYKLTLVLVNEAIINQIILDVYNLNGEDRKKLQDKNGYPIGELPVLDEAKSEFIKQFNVNNELIKNFILNLHNISFDEQFISELKQNFELLYQSNNGFEEFCINHQINPINVWYLFKKNNVLPQARVEEIAMEFIADALRIILNEDEDGIIPLANISGERGIFEILEEHCLSNGISPAQFAQLDHFFRKPLQDYLINNFFKNFSDYLNLFPNLPKTPFIWHLSSGEHHGFEAFIIIYKWNRDSLYKLKSTYITKRIESLQYRLDSLKDNNSGQAQTEKEQIRLQIFEIESFVNKIDELINENYDPKLDDGVGKNIAPLQKKGMLKADVLNKKQLDKYLKAEW